MKYIFRIVIVVYLLTGCDNVNKINKSEKDTIKGNWYYFYKIDDDVFNSKDVLLNYNEVYIADDSIYQYIEGAGLIPPKKYSIINDSLFIGSENKSGFGGIIESIDDKNIQFSMFEKNDFIYLKISDKIMLEDYINKKVTLEEYSKAYNIRAVNLKKNQ